jgi:uncharacterized protein YbjT (DUF2867 family)
LSNPSVPGILITGVTGNVGREIYRILGERGIAARAPVRAEFDFRRPETFANAFEGIEKMLLVRPPAISDPNVFRPSLEAAKKSGVRHIVFLSLLGAEKNPFVPHRRLEKLIKEIGFEYTFLRPSFFMQNLSTIHAADIRDLAEIIVPAGNGRTSFIDVRDIAEVAALALSETGHEDQAYALTGAEALTYKEVSKIMTEVLGRPICYRSSSIVRFASVMRSRKQPWALISVMIAIYTITRFGFAGTVTGEVKRLLGREPISLEKFVGDYRAVWT